MLISREVTVYSSISKILGGFKLRAENTYLSIDERSSFAMFWLCSWLNVSMTRSILSFFRLRILNAIVFSIGHKQTLKCLSDKSNTKNIGYYLG